MKAPCSITNPSNVGRELHYARTGPARGCETISDNLCLIMTFVPSGEQSPDETPSTRVQPNACDYVEEAFRAVAQIALQPMPPGNILVFMPGVNEVEKTCRRIGKHVSGV